MNTDAKLLQLTAQKNKRAFKELYNQTSPQIYRLTLQYLRLHCIEKKSFVENILQETYLEVWKSCELYNPKKKSVIAWMFSIARKKATAKMFYFNQSEPDTNDRLYLRRAFF